MTRRVDPWVGMVLEDPADALRFAQLRAESKGLGSASTRPAGTLNVTWHHRRAEKALALPEENVIELRVREGAPDPGDRYVVTQALATIGVELRRVTIEAACDEEGPFDRIMIAPRAPSPLACGAEASLVAAQADEGAHG